MSENLNEQVVETAQPTAGKASFWWGFLGFWYPVIGLILYFVLKSKLPLVAKKSLKGTIIGAIVYVVCIVIYVVFIGILAGIAASSGMYY